MNTKKIYICDDPSSIFITYDELSDTIHFHRCCMEYKFFESKYKNSFNDDSVVRSTVLTRDEFMKIPNLTEYLKNLYMKDVGHETLCSMLFNPHCPVYCGVPTKLKDVFISISKACNLNCDYCMVKNSKSGKDHVDSDKRKELYFNTLYNLNNIERITLTDFGEPFYYKDEILEWIKQLKNVKTLSCTSNGTILTPDYTSKLSKILNDKNMDFIICFSVDGKDFSNKNRNHPNVDANIKYILNNCKNINIWINACTNSKEEFEYIKNKYIQMGVKSDQIRFNNVFDYNGNKYLAPEKFLKN